MCCGIDVIDRLARGLLRQPGVREIILIDGINYIGFSHTTDL